MSISNEAIDALLEGVSNAAQQWNIAFTDEAQRYLRSYIQQEALLGHSALSLGRAVAVLGYCAMGKALYESLHRSGKAEVHPVDVNSCIWYSHDDPTDRCWRAVTLIEKNYSTFSELLPHKILDVIPPF